jgi:transglutaminase-like putative cysteine protease
MASRAGKALGFVAKHVAYAIWVSLMVLIPLFGFWLASSLAAYNNATQWFSLLVGLALFPILPVGWELFYAWRRKKNPKASPAILTRLDRLVLRTLVINGLFLGGMMWQARAESFRALAVRGDWMLDGFDGPIASTMRGWMLGFADRLDRRTQKADDAYGKSDKAPENVKPPPPEPVKPPIDPTTQTPDAEPTRPPGSWPLPAERNPLVTAITEDEAHSVEAVGEYFAVRITDKKELVKALHDYVIGRLTYDDNALKLIEARDYDKVPPQTAEAVFESRTGVCEGYARLMVALGKAAGVEIAYVTGSIRDSERRLQISDDPWDTSMQEALEGVGHAWNAVKIDDRWYPMDVTWDDSSTHATRTTYLFTPPQLMAYDHFPDDPKWQLLDKPLSLGDFVRQPMMMPSIGELGLTLVSPTRSQVTVDGEITIELDNPYGAAISARALREGSADGDKGERCDVTEGKKTTVTCKLADGEYEIRLFGAPASRTKSGSYMLDQFGTILANSH